jgi:hypothetical protein
MSTKPRQNLAARLKSLLVHRHLPLVSALLGMLLGIPTLWGGWGPADDVLQRSFIQSSSLSDVLTRLFVFLDPSINFSRMDAGYFPWWTFEEARVIFFRPFAAFSLWLDYQFWPNSNLLMHLHSVIIYGVLCLVAAVLFRRLMGKSPQAGLATLLFALSTSHIGCVVSLAARNLLLTTIFGMLAIIFHDRWRRENWHPGVILSLTCLLFSLLSAETGVATCAYLLAYIIFLDNRSWRARTVSLLPYIALTAAWLLLYQINGFGAVGSGFYANPLHEPLQFGVSVLERAPFLLIGQWILPDPVVYTVLSDGARIILWFLSVAVLVFIAVLLVPLLKRSMVARFWALGMLLAVLPVCAVSPASGRHLTFISLGAFGLMGELITGRFFTAAWAPAGRGWRGAALVMSIIFLGLHLVIYPTAGSFVRPAMDTYAIAVTDIGQMPGIESKDIIIVNAPSPSLFMYLPAYRKFLRQPLPAHLRILAPGFSQVSLTAVDEYTVIIQPEDGFLFSAEILDLEGTAFLPLFHSSYSFQYGDGLFRGPGYPMELGQEINLTGVSIEVISLTEDGRPQAARVTFDLPLEDESLAWLMWDWANASYVPLVLPAINETRIIAGPY